MDLDTILQLAGSSLRLATPLLLACLAGLYSERAGIFDIGLEGKMLAAAFAAGAFAAVTGSAWIGLLAGVVASSLLSLLHGFASITLKGNQLISGVAINFLASGMTALIGQNWFGLGGQTPQLQPDQRFLVVRLGEGRTRQEQDPRRGGERQEQRHREPVRGDDGQAPEQGDRRGGRAVAPMRGRVRPAVRHALSTRTGSGCPPGKRSFAARPDRRSRS